MTEEEMAEEYEENAEYIEVDDYGRKVYGSIEIEDAFLAGLKAGKPKWHKVADGDLPEENHFVLVLNKQTGYEIARHAPFEEYHLDNWVTVDNRSLLPFNNNPSVIAWCEIPKYTEE